MSINPLFKPIFFETALGRARPISFEMDLAAPVESWVHGRPSSGLQAMKLRLS
jgi:hypothetical protein